MTDAARTIVVDGVEYAPVNCDGERMRILIVDNRGLTFVGLVDLASPGEWVTIRNARCIVRWGTSRHLAELVNGPLPNTLLGSRHDATVRRNNIVLVYDVEQGKWR